MIVFTTINVTEISLLKLLRENKGGSEIVEYLLLLEHYWVF